MSLTVVKDLSVRFRNKFGMTEGGVGMTTSCHAELVYATRAFALRKLVNAALACLGHQHPSDGFVCEIWRDIFENLKGLNL